MYRSGNTTACRSVSERVFNRDPGPAKAIIHATDAIEHNKRGKEISIIDMLYRLANQGINMNKDTIITLLKYKRWIDAETLKTIKEINASTYSEKRHLMLRLMNHIYVVDRIFKANLSRQQHGYQALNTPETPTIDELEISMAESINGYIEYVNAMSTEDLAETIAFRFVDGGAGEMTAIEMLNHMLFHGTYHRGAVGWLISECGGTAPKDVLTVFLRDHNH